MKIFLRFLFTFAFIGVRKAQSAEDDFDFNYQALTDGSRETFSEELSANTDTENNYTSYRSGLLRRGDRNNFQRKNEWFFETITRYSTSCACGIINKGAELIVRGQDVYPPYRYPWTVAIQSHGNTFCGGALINDQFILTAAHCIARDEDEKPKLRTLPQSKYLLPREVQIALLTKTDDVTPGPPIEDIIPHPRFDFITANHDIAILKLRRKIICNVYNRPICLPRDDMPVNLGDYFFTAGWGTEGNLSKVGTKELKQAEIKTVSSSYCKEKLGPGMKDNFYCLKGIGQTSPCHGDSGGPMFTEKGNRAYLFGVVSMHTNLMCNPKSAFLYSKIPKYMDWINRVTHPSYRHSSRPQASWLKKQICNWQIDKKETRGRWKIRCKLKYPSRKYYSSWKKRMSY